MPTVKKLTSQAEFARHRNISRARVSQLMPTLRAKGLVTGTGKIKVVEADEFLNATLDPSKRRGKQQSQPELHVDAGTQIEIPDIQCIDGKWQLPRGLTESDARILKLLLQARQADLDFKRESGGLAPLEKCKAIAFNHGRALRDAMLDLPARISGRLASMRDQHEIEIFLTDSIKAALRREIAKGGTDGE